MPRHLIGFRGYKHIMAGTFQTEVPYVAWANLKLAI